VRALRDRGVRAVVLDIEGTTTPMAFVHEILFPYARTHLAGFLRDPARAELFEELAPRFAAEHHAEPEADQVPPWQEDTREALLNSVTVYAGWLMDRDRKSPALKALQGQIWEGGYRSGQIRGAVYPDVPPAMKRWHEDGIIVAIYSSGSVLAQRLIFSMTDEGDLTPFISHFFDTGVGPKKARESYERIASTLGQEPIHTLFISDVAEELDAAHMAGFLVALAIRPDHFAPNPSGYEELETFEGI
jgi:enolase-phosphatase E1